MVGPQSLSAAAQQKVALRRRLVERRLALSLEERSAQAERAVEALLSCFPLATGDVVALYASFASEPSTSDLRRQLQMVGVNTLLPAVLADHDLSWTDDAGIDRGVDAIGGCALVVVPGLAGDLDGNRLGRGGGSYDRALRRAPLIAPRALLLYRGELLDSVPHEAHDVPITHLALPDGVQETSAWLRA